ncbi:hypothetical protein BTE48_07030 [Oceanospirillum multiglobuliferum]|uniref:Uncharacterized protein n=1 Tax=Oceanospirillum multiglobuliferum TaxID=64969 RepID=A0A1V4T7N7_9GAMM|nr:hypothetical protein BTE48_07030 [Oceanospirillum multiglobuliferum]
MKETIRAPLGTLIAGIKLLRFSFSTGAIVASFARSVALFRAKMPVTTAVTLVGNYCFTKS